MPITKWQIEPTQLISPTSFNHQNGYRGTELTDAINASFTSVIVQLSCLARHAEMMFGELVQESHMLAARTNALSNKVSTLKQEAQQLNPVFEEVSLEQVSMNKPFKSAEWRDVSLATRPQAIVEQYQNAAPPPALQKLNTFRGDDKDCLKMYTNPEFFFELWCAQIQKEVEQKRKVPRKKKAPKKAEEPVVVIQRKRLYLGVDAEFLPPKPTPASKKPDISVAPSDSTSPAEPPPLSPRPPSVSTQGRPGGPVVMRKSSTGSALPPPPPLSPKPVSVGGQPPTGRPSMPPPPAGVSRLTRESGVLPTPPPTPKHSESLLPPPSERNEEFDDMPPLPPPVVRPAGTGGRQNRLSKLSMPPPPPLSICLLDSSDAEMGGRMPTLLEDDFPRPPSMMVPQPPRSVPPPPPAVGPMPPPPPPPPPPPMDQVVPAMESGFGLRSAPTGGHASAVKRQETQKNRSSRGDLLNAIRQGMKLRNVEERKQRDDEVKPRSTGDGVGGLFDVSKILEIRRQALEDDDESEVEDSEDWD